MSNDMSLLLLRLGVGLNMLLLHGWQKIAGGSSMWRGVGEAMPNFGIPEMAIVWGLLAALAESLGSVLLILGVNFRIVCLVMAFDMLVAASHHLQMNDLLPGSSWSGAGYALLFLVCFLALAMSGPGKHVLKIKA